MQDEPTAAGHRNCCRNCHHRIGHTCCCRKQFIDDERNHSKEPPPPPAVTGCGEVGENCNLYHRPAAEEFLNRTPFVKSKQLISNLRPTTIRRPPFIEYRCENDTNTLPLAAAEKDPKCINKFEDGMSNEVPTTVVSQKSLFDSRNITHCAINDLNDNSSLSKTRKPSECLQTTSQTGKTELDVETIAPPTMDINAGKSFGFSSMTNLNNQKTATTIMSVNNAKRTSDDMSSEDSNCFISKSASFKSSISSILERTVIEWLCRRMKNKRKTEPADKLTGKCSNLLTRKNLWRSMGKNRNQVDINENNNPIGVAKNTGDSNIANVTDAVVTEDNSNRLDNYYTISPPASEQRENPTSESSIIEREAGSIIGEKNETESKVLLSNSDNIEESRVDNHQHPPIVVGTNNHEDINDSSPITTNERGRNVNDDDDDNKTFVEMITDSKKNVESEMRTYKCKCKCKCGQQRDSIIPSSSSFSSSISSSSRGENHHDTDGSSERAKKKCPPEIKEQLMNVIDDSSKKVEKLNDDYRNPADDEDAIIKMNRECDTVKKSSTDGRPDKTTISSKNRTDEITNINGRRKISSDRVVNRFSGNRNEVLYPKYLELPCYNKLTPKNVVVDNSETYLPEADNTNSSTVITARGSDSEVYKLTGKNVVVDNSETYLPEADNTNSCTVITARGSDSEVEISDMDEPPPSLPEIEISEKTQSSSDDDDEKPIRLDDDDSLSVTIQQHDVSLILSDSSSSSNRKKDEENKVNRTDDKSEENERKDADEKSKPDDVKTKDDKTGGKNERESRKNGTKKRDAQVEEDKEKLNKRTELQQQPIKKNNDDKLKPGGVGDNHGDQKTTTAVPSTADQDCPATRPSGRQRLSRAEKDKRRRTFLYDRQVDVKNNLSYVYRRRLLSGRPIYSSHFVQHYKRFKRPPFWNSKRAYVPYNVFWKASFINEPVTIVSEENYMEIITKPPTAPPAATKAAKKKSQKKDKK